MQESKSGYVRPDAIPSDMGGDGGTLDERLTGVLRLLEQAPLDGVRSVLDVGTGKGQVARFLAEKGMAVVGTGLEFASYGIAPEAFRAAHGVSLIECPVERMPFADGQFDAVVMSHILEHCDNIGQALREVRRVLTDSGRLFVFVPPYIEYVCAGHVNTGWNIGQLLLVLLLNGFDVRQGRFIEYGGSVCAFVRKTSTPLPPLRGDRGDIRILADGGFFPLPIMHDQPPPAFVTARNQAALVSSDAFDDGFYGRVAAIGWDADDLRRLGSPSHLSRRQRLLQPFGKAIPQRIRGKLASILERLAGFLRNVEDVE